MKLNNLSLKTLKLSREDLERLVLPVVLLVVIMAIFGLVLVKPTLAQLWALAPKTTQLREEVQRLEAAVVRQPTVKKRHDTLREELATLEQSLPKEQELDALLRRFSVIEKASKVKIISVDAKPPSRPAPPQVSASGKSATQAAAKSAKDAELLALYQEVPIAIQVRGGYHQLGRFINELEMGEPPLRVVNFNIQGDSENPLIHKAEFIVATYVVREAPPHEERPAVQGGRAVLP